MHLFPPPITLSTAFETCQSKCPSRWQVPVTLLWGGNRAVFMQEFWVTQTNRVFVFAGRWDSSGGAARTRHAWCRGPSAFQRHWTKRASLHHLMIDKKGKDWDQDFVILTSASLRQEHCSCPRYQAVPPARWLLCTRFRFKLSLLKIRSTIKRGSRLF